MGKVQSNKDDKMQLLDKRDNLDQKYMIICAIFASSCIRLILNFAIILHFLLG